jgi:hypothetical protein
MRNENSVLTPQNTLHLSDDHLDNPVVGNTAVHGENETHKYTVSKSAVCSLPPNFRGGGIIVTTMI